MKMKLLIVAIMAASFTSFAQVGIGTTSPEGALDVVSTNSGLILPRVENTAVVTSPVNGMIIYDQSAKCFKGYQEDSWTACGLVKDLISSIVLASNNPAADGTPSLADLTAAGVVGATGSQMYYEVAIATASPAPTSLADLQAIITVINNMRGAATTAIVELVSPATGRIWMDRNLGAIKKATSSTDVDSYGDYYQWGRAYDDHQLTTSTTINAIETSSTPDHGSFITTSGSPNDWLAPQNDILWNSGSEANPVKTTNDPCPNGYRLPTAAEFGAETGITDSATALSQLALPPAGRRNGVDASFSNKGSHGFYWTTTPTGTNARNLIFSSTANVGSNYRVSGFSVRCIKY